ncbi:hypothetical protein Pedsa_1749 [Pseudopedobacter saltans DSM 12145]|uniref:DUF4112 domain-containing protein n=1 Tax=Pseudopedobacter saltans (strain ATCC 51119 / DSM 12145 / JCM 21818 / CCUG 39354 / LMG 10337 / NBRC 100064 / NCIMB 13643) TaxID=762903 RepID=F0S844_PSESL|nr:DUF4112 domain-containing protein [Pseudopedobacter saltans]ADY52306.1 hypothetical protein Pedsa_1749 [Pseudopedobacter saltans DSM 12145]
MPIANQTDPRLKRLEQLARLMDSQFKIGKFRFGLDPLINLIPFLGDAIGFLISLFIVYTMYKHGASGKLVIKMILNVLVDALVGAIPVLGWAFDFYFKANEKNVLLLKEHYTENKHKGSGLDIILIIFVIFFILIAFFIYLIWLISSYILSLIL